METYVYILTQTVITYCTCINYVRDMEPDVERLLKTANERFTTKLFTEVVKSNPGSSCVLSGLFVLSPLAQLALASVGPSHDEILKAIGMPNDYVTKKVFAEVNTKLRSVKGIELKPGSKAYVRVNYTLNDDFAAVSRDVFNPEFEILKSNFSSGDDAVDEFNRWLEDPNEIPVGNYMDTGRLTSDITAVLVNAIYFRGRWKTPFEGNVKWLLYFYSFKGTFTVPYIKQLNYFKYVESKELNAKVLEIECEGNDTSLVIVLPVTYLSLDSVMEKLKDPTAFSNARRSMYYLNVEVILPKFRIETTINLKELLPKLNINRLFSEKLARLDNLIDGQNQIFVSHAFQKAIIEIYEGGASTFAEKNVETNVTAAPTQRYYTKFWANRPFLFILMEKDNILLNGLYQT